METEIYHEIDPAVNSLTLWTKKKKKKKENKDRRKHNVRLKTLWV